MQSLGKSLFVLGLILMFMGGVIFLFGKISFPFGRLPGDFVFSRKNVTVFAPMTSMVLLSIIITIVLNLVSRWFK
jgi:hypothetical protein